MPMHNLKLRHQPCIGNTHRVVVSLGRRVSHKQSVCGCVDIDDHHQTEQEKLFQKIEIVLIQLIIHFGKNQLTLVTE